MLREQHLGGPRCVNHRRPGGPSHRDRGFTLLELLVALTILSIVMGGVYGVFQTVSRNLRVVENEAELTQTARIILGDLRRELGSIYPVRVPVTEEQAEELGLDYASLDPAGIISFGGEDDQDEEGRPLDLLRFTAVVGATGGGQDPQSDIAELAYQIDQDPETLEEGLVRRVNRFPGLAIDPQQQIKTEVLTPLATSLEIRYWAGDQVEDLGSVDPEELWVPAWSDPDLVPAAVEISLGLTPRQSGAEERVYRMVCSIPLRTPREDLRQRNQKREEAASTAEETAPEEAATPGEDEAGAAAAAAAAAAQQGASGGAGEALPGPRPGSRRRTGDGHATP